MQNLGPWLGAAFEDFKNNFLTYMKQGFQKWLFGELGKAGLKMPKKFDAKGIFGLTLQVLGITETNIFKRIELKVGKKNADRVKMALVFGHDHEQ